MATKKRSANTVTNSNTLKIRKVETSTRQQQQPHLLFEDLPVEVIDKVISNLDRRDIKECIRVSFKWNALFYPTLFKSVKFYSPARFSKLFQIMKQSTKQENKRKTRAAAASNITFMNIRRLPNIGFNIRHMDIKSGVMSEITMDALATYCPNVHTLVFRWDPVGKNSQVFIPSLSSLQEPNPTRHMAHTPIPFLQRYYHNLSVTSTVQCNSLRSLTLYKDNVSFRSETSRVSSETSTDMSVWCSSVLCFVPQLENLVFNIKFLSISLNDMEKLHAACPHLKALEIFTPVLLTVALEASPIVPTHTMENFTLQSNHWVYTKPFHNNSWFIYIQHKYPGLKKLNIIATDILSHNQPYFNHTVSPSESTPSPSPEDSEIQLKNYFPRLEHLDISRFSQRSSAAWPQLVYGIRSIALHDDASDLLDTWIRDVNLPSVNQHHQQRLQQLAIHILPNKLDNFKYCVQLSKLNLDGKYRLTDYKIQTLPLDTLLSHCHSLEHLRISSYVILCQESNNESPNKPLSTATALPLKEMIIKDSAFVDSGVLCRVGQLCPQLWHLSITNCNWRNPEDEHYIVHINMPYQRFRYLKLDKVGTCRKPIAYYGRRQGNQIITDAVHEMHPSWTRPDTANYGITDYLLLKTNGPLMLPEQEPTKEEVEGIGQKNHQAETSMLFEYKYLQMSRIRTDSTKTITWLEKEISNEKATPDDQKRSYAQKTFRHWSVIIHCQHVDHLYFNGIQLDNKLDKNT